MEKYIEGNKAAWEEAFDNRTDSWGADIPERIRNEEYPFFNEETRSVLKQIRTVGAVIGQFCCNNGRELLSLVKSGKAKKGIGFDIAENQVAFANQKAGELNLPCLFEAVNVYDIDDLYREVFDVVIITIGALCWFKDLNRFFAIVAKCMKPGAIIVINEEHPCTHMLAAEGDETVGIITFGICLKHVDGLALAVYHHQAALVAAIDFIHRSVFVLEHPVRRFQCNLLVRQLESEL